MFNFKPSELPVGVIIQDREHGMWRQDAPGVWWDLSPHCSDCDRVAFTEGPSDQDYVLWGANVWQIITTPVDEYFKHFTVEAWPTVVVEYILKRYDHLEKPETVLREALEDIRDGWVDAIAKDELQLVDVVSKHPELEWKVLNSFEYILIEVNEIGQFRCNDRIFSPVWDEESDQWIATVVDENGEEHPLDPEWFVKQYFNKDWQRND